MLNCFGLVGISKKMQVTINKTDSGAFFNFLIASQNPKSKETSTYQASIWVPQHEIEDWKSKIVPGSVFLLKNGELTTQFVKVKERSFIKIKIERNSFIHLSSPYWPTRSKNER